MVTRVCKVCGAEYEYCKTFRRDPNMFRWQDVACCQEHGSEYFAKVMASRENKHEPEQVAEKVDEVPAKAKRSTKRKAKEVATIE